MLRRSLGVLALFVGALVVGSVVPPAVGAAPAGPAAAGPTISMFATGLHTGGGLASAPGGALYVGDPVAHVVWHIDSSGTATVVAGNGAGEDSFDHEGADALSVPVQPIDVTVDSAGVLYIATYRFVYAMTPDGILHWVFGIDPYPVSGVLRGVSASGDSVRASQLIDWMCFPSHGCVPPWESVQVFPRYGVAGAPSTEVASPSVTQPRRLASGPGGERYVVDGGITRTDVAPVNPFDFSPLDPGTLGGLAVDPSGRVVVALSDRHALARIETDGSVGIVAGTLDTPGSSGDGGAATAALLDHPDDVAVAGDGTIYVGTGTSVRAITPAPEPGPSPASPPLRVTGTAVRNPAPAAVQVSWSVPWYSGGSAISGYAVTAVPGPGGCTAIAPQTTCLVTGLPPGSSQQFSVVAQNAQGSSPAGLSGSVQARSGSAFHAVSPTRVLDSRTATGGWPGALGAGAPAATNLTIPPAAVPGASTAVVLNVTVTGGTADSFLTVYPSGTAVPTASSLNFGAGQTIANLVTVKVGAANQVAFFNALGSVHVIVDLVGYYEDTDEANGAGFVPQAPVRVLDSRTATGGWSGKLTSAAAKQLSIPGLPATATAVVLNVTATNSTANSYLKVAPYAVAPMPNVSNLNFATNETAANLVTVKVGSFSSIRIGTAVGATDVVADLVGYYDTAAGEWFHPMAPTRALDSRGPIGGWLAKLQAGPAAARTLALAGQVGIPLSAVGAVMNTTVTNGTAGSFLTVYPAGASVPTASTVNFAAGETRPNLAVVQFGSGGAAAFCNAVGATDVVVDVLGYFGPA